MNKTELIAKIADNAGLTKADAERALNGLITSIETTLKSGDKVVLTGFGTFEVRDRAARTGRNPRTGESIQIPASKAPAFKVGKSLKEAIK